MNFVNILNIVDFKAMRYKKQYNDSRQVLVSRQIGNSIEKDNFSAMYLSNSYSWNYLNFFEIFSASKNEDDDMQLTWK